MTKKKISKKGKFEKNFNFSESKVLSKTAQLKKDRAINKIIRKTLDAKDIEDARAIEDAKDPIINVQEPSGADIQHFNSKMFIDALKDSGVNTESESLFADMERIVNNNESIRELVDVKNIRMKTNVTEEQHKYIVILYGAYRTLLSRYAIDFKGLRMVLDEFIEIAPSIEGNRASQFVTAHQAMAQAVANASHNNNAMRDVNEMKQ